MAAKLAKYMDNRSLLIEAHITGPKGSFDCPIELKFYGTNEPVERENLLSQMRVDKLPVGHAADRKRKEAAAYKERQRLAIEAAKQAKKHGGAVIGLGPQHRENTMSDFVAGSSQGFGPGPSLEDIIGNSERFNPRNFEQVLEEFGVKEQDLVSWPPYDVQHPLILMSFRRQCPRLLNPRLSVPSCIPSSCRGFNGCWIRRLRSFRLKARKVWFNFGNDIQEYLMPSRI